MNKIKVGIIGYGFSASIFHVPLLKTIKEFEITKVVSSNAQKVKNDLETVEVVSDIEQIINDENIELVIITTPNTLHYPMTKKALQAGKHVVVEKPFVVESKEAEELIQIAKEKNRVLSVYHNRRWDNDFLTVKHCIQKGLLGDIFTYESHFDRYRPQVRNRWREQNIKGSGILYDLGSHLIDQALHLFGLPQFVTADVFPQRTGAEVDDYFHLILGYDRLRVILHSGSIVKSPGPRFQVHGSKGSFIKYGLDSQEEALKQGYKPGDAGWGADREEWYGEFTTGEGERSTTVKVETIPGSYESYYQGIFEAIRHHKPVPVTAEEAMNTIKVIEYALKSSKEKRTISLAESLPNHL
jgi:scyllo-inositol 2-dehydrogenase (NADP+)